MKISELLLWRYRGDAFVRRFKALNTLHYKWPIKVEFDGELYHVSDDIQEVYIARQRRLVFYWEGVQKRLLDLAGQYLIDRISFNYDDVVVDVGANVGELGKWFQMKGGGVKYVALEPSVSEYNANKKNNPQGVCLNMGAWDSEGVLEFFDRNDTGDSSLFRIAQSETPVRVLVRRIDQLEELKDFSSIKLLKVEAEGAEPEIIRGAVGILSKVEYVTVDCGFERGAEEKSTADEVISILSENGFICIGCNPIRLIFLFRRIEPKPAPENHPARLGNELSDSRAQSTVAR